MVDGKAKITSFESAAQRLRSQSLTNGKCLEKMPIQLIHPLNDDESGYLRQLLCSCFFRQRRTIAFGLRSGQQGSEHRNSARMGRDDRAVEWPGRRVSPLFPLTLRRRPANLTELMMNNGGVPDVLRGKVWPLMSKAVLDAADLGSTYKLLLEKDAVAEQVILRDIHRTFPAHDYFKQSGGEGQEKLYRISKAYSLYDEEVGYCQGLSFLAAALLLHVSLPCTCGDGLADGRGHVLLRPGPHHVPVRPTRPFQARFRRPPPPLFPASEADRGWSA